MRVVAVINQKGGVGKTTTTLNLAHTLALAESPSYGLSIFEYQSKSRGAEDYKALADDFLSGRTCK